MSGWTEGYVAEIDYTCGYYAELNPQQIKLPFLQAGLIAPKIATACELGFGQGLSVNVHAASSDVQWYGTDFNPSHAGFAQELASVSGCNAKLFDDSFAQFVQRTDLPQFDYIGLHGVWSWISGQNRQLLIDFIERKLNVGGVLYVSYNTLPGWSVLSPLRHMLTTHAKQFGSTGSGITANIRNAFESVEKLLASNPVYLRQNPAIADSLKNLKNMDVRYLAHEFFNADWEPMHFADMARWLEPAKLSYACCARPIENIKELNLSAEQIACVNATTDTVMQETVRDFCVNQRFRRDYWVKGPRKLLTIDGIEQWRQQRLVMIVAPEDIAMTIQCAQGEGQLQEAVYRPLIALLADFNIHLIGDIETQLCKGNDIRPDQIGQAILVLVSSRSVALAQEEDLVAQRRPHTDQLNAHLIKLARDNGYIDCMASPVTGGGIPVGRIQRLFLLARSLGNQSSDEWAAYAWQILCNHGHKLLKDGKTLESDADNLAEMKLQAQQFRENRLPILQHLQVV